MILAGDYSLVAQPGGSQTTVAVLVADAMPGVRSALRWLLAADEGVVVVAEAGDVTTARASIGGVDVIVSGLQLPDGCAADLVPLGLPVVVHTWLPEDDREDGWTSGCARVVRHGDLRGHLIPAVRIAAQRSGREPERDRDVAGSEPGSR